MSNVAVPASRLLDSLGPAKIDSKDGDSICKRCRKINFQDLLQNPRQKIHYRDKSSPSPHIMRYTNGCKLCLLMFQRVPTHDMGETFELRSYSFKKNSYWARKSSLNARDSVLLKVGWQYIFFNTRTLDDVFCKLAGDGSQALNCAQPVQDIWDHVKARLWLEACLKCHGSRCKQESLRIPDMNLIDCKEMAIVKATQEMQWLALSYVWGVNPQTEDHGGYREGSSISPDVPGTVRDAISVTLQLGYRYLWVDEYCIDQKDDNHRNNQIKKMDQIYRGADLTIVAAAGENKRHGLPGVGSTKRGERKIVRVGDVIVFSNGPQPNEEAECSTWFTRAWTFQEGLLSKRLLVFTEYQMSFYCSASSCMESLGYLDPNVAHQVIGNYDPINLFKSIQHLTSPRWNWYHFATTLRMYSIRQITKESDTLDAFLGVFNHIRRSRPTTQLLRGLPFFKTSEEIPPVELIDSFEKIVAAALSWYSDEEFDSPQRRHSTFPSWTWAGWSGSMIFWLRTIEGDNYHPFLRHARLESSSGQIVVSSALYKDNIQHELDTVTLIQFEAPVIPAASFSFTGGPLTDTGSGDSMHPKGLKIRVAGRELSLDEHLRIYTSDQLIENIRKRRWSCFLLCSQEEVDRRLFMGFALVVHWKADQVTAERIGSFRICAQSYDEARSGPLGEESWPWRRVRLI